MDAPVVDKVREQEAEEELTSEEIAADIISLIRRYPLGSTLIVHEARIRRAVEKLKRVHRFTQRETLKTLYRKSKMLRLERRNKTNW